MKIYTKTGDYGETSLFNGTRVKKNNLRIITYGTVDEVNSNIGLLLYYLHQDEKLKDLRYCYQGFKINCLFWVVI